MSENDQFYGLGMRLLEKLDMIGITFFDDITGNC